MPSSASPSSPSWKRKREAGAECRSLEPRNRDLLAVLERGLVGADTDHRPVHGRLRVGHRRLAAEARHQKVVDEVRMRAAMAAALEEREVVRVLDRGRLRKAL